MTRTLSVWVGAEIIYLYGTVNGEAATFTLIGDGEWQAIVPRSEDDNYLLHLEAYSANGLEGTYDYVLYYGVMPVVIDRTQADVQSKTEKGYYNCTDLNRVGHNVEYLAGVLNGYGYLVSVSPKTDWTISDIPRVADMTLYLADLNALKDKFYGTTPLPESMNNLTVTAANDIEKLLLEIETYINRMVAGFRKCGTFKSGQGVILP
jgi:hypothetical protein